MKIYWYDYGARFYDPELGRFTGIDPIAEDYVFVTPYNYAENSPIANIDLWGLQALPYTLIADAVSWFTEKGGAVKRLLTGTSGTLNIPSGVNIPDQARETLKFTGTARDIESVTEAVEDVGRAVLSVIENVPGVESVVDVAGTAVNTAQGNFDEAAMYAAGILLPVSGRKIKFAEQGAEKALNAAKKVHGNSKQSQKLTSLYKLNSKDGTYLKTGITSQPNPERRYSIKFMKDKIMTILDRGSRTDMLKKEREIVEKDPGPLNKELWAGTKK